MIIHATMKNKQAHLPNNRPNTVITSDNINVKTEYILPNKDIIEIGISNNIDISINSIDSSDSTNIQSKKSDKKPYQFDTNYSMIHKNPIEPIQVKYFVFFNKYKTTPIAVDIICDYIISICNLSPYFTIGENNEIFYSTFIIDRVDMGINFLHRLLAQKTFQEQFIYIKGDNINNLLEICMPATISYRNNENDITKVETLLLIITYDYKRNNITIQRASIDADNILSNLEIPLNLDEAIRVTYNLDTYNLNIDHVNPPNDITNNIISYTPSR